MFLPGRHLFMEQPPVIAGGKVISLTQLCDAAAASNELSDSSRSSSTRIVRESEPESVRDCVFSNVTGEVSKMENPHNGLSALKVFGEVDLWVRRR